MTAEDLQDAKPRVSVLMTIYNAAPFLRESIDSLLAQSYPGWELVAIENGSYDESPSILASYTDRRIRVFSLRKNIGRTLALRYAFDRARGEYIAVLDADDVALPLRLEREVMFLDSHPEVLLLGTWAQHIDTVGQVIDNWEPPAGPAELYDCLGWMNPFVHSSVLYRREAAAAVGGYPAQYVYAQDLGLILLLAQRGKLAMIAEHLCQLRISSGSVTHSAKYRADVIRERLDLLHEAAQTLRFDSVACRRNRYAIARQEIRYGWLLLHCGDFLDGLEIIIGTLWRNPAVLWSNRFFNPSLNKITRN